MRPLIKMANDYHPINLVPSSPTAKGKGDLTFQRKTEWNLGTRLSPHVRKSKVVFRARSIQPKFPEISVQNSMDRFGPTGKVSKKRVHLLRWTTFPGRTGCNFGWMDRALGFWIHIEITQSKYCTQSGFISQLTGLDSGSQSLVGSALFHLGCIPDSKAQDSRFHKQKYMGGTYFTGIYVFQWYRSESYHIRHACAWSEKTLQSILGRLGALSIWQTLRFEISENLRDQCNGTFRSHIPDPSHRAFGYCSCKQDTKERYWGQQFCEIERDISVRPTEVTWPVKVDHLEGWSQIFRSDRIEMFCFIWFLTEISGILGWAPWGSRGMHSFPRKMIKFWVLGNAVWSVAAGNSKCFVPKFKRGFRSSTLRKTAYIWRRYH